MSFNEVLDELPGLTPEQRQILIRRALELEERGDWSAAAAAQLARAYGDDEPEYSEADLRP
jgi:hypothetical protein